jgi:hypothetical protein
MTSADIPPPQGGGVFSWDIDKGPCGKQTKKPFKKIALENNKQKCLY